MSDVEKITFDNHYRRREDEAKNKWERQAVKNAKHHEKQQRVRSWLFFLICTSYMAFGASVSMSAVFAAIGDYSNLATCASAAFISIIAALIFSDKLER